MNARGVRCSSPEALAAQSPVTNILRIGVRLAAHLTGSATLAPACDLAQWEPPRGNQGPTPTCFAHSTAWATATAFARAGSPLWVPSPKLIAAGVTALDRAASTPAGAAPATLDDEGGSIASVANFLGRYGVEPMRGPTADGRNSDVDPATMNEEIDLADLETSGQRILTGAYAVKPGTSSTSDELAACLDAGLPIVKVFWADPAYDNLRPGDMLGAPDMSAGGWHATYLSGYMMIGNDRVFLDSGSYGPDFCDGGRTLFGPAALEATAELWPWDVTRGTIGR